MEIKLTKPLGEWQELYLGIQTLMQEALPFKEAYWVARDVDRIESAIKSLDNIRKKMLDQYCDKDEEGKPIMVSAPEGLQGMQYQLTQFGATFQQEWNEIVNQEIEISIFTISPDKLGEKMETIKPSVLKGAMAIFAE